MKTCPYCAEEIKDEAIRCRWCLTWLVKEIPAGAEGPAPKAAEAAADVAPKAAEAEPRTERLEPVPQATVVRPVSAAKPAEPVVADRVADMGPGPMGQVPAQEPKPSEPAPVREPAPAEAPASSAPASADAGKIEFTHTGTRYLLGYGVDYFGIWDRNAPQEPIERFPRNDDGWGSAWQRYSTIEVNWMDLRTGQKSG